MIADLHKQSSVRLKRAQLARCLLRLTKQGLIEPSQHWSFESIDALPTWIAEGQQRRAKHQLLCGAISAAEQLRLCIDQRLILAFQKLIGQQAFHEILLTDFSAAITPEHRICVNVLERFVSQCNEIDHDVTADTVASELLLLCGDAILRATLRETLPKVAIDVLVSTTPPIGELNVEHSDTNADNANIISLKALEFLQRGQVNSPNADYYAVEHKFQQRADSNVANSAVVNPMVDMASPLSTGPDAGLISKGATQ